MEFCNECGALWYPKKTTKEGYIVYQCRKCGFRLVDKSENKEDFIFHIDLDREEQKIWFVKAEQE